ncbi:MAG: hypothetical protein IT377_13300 [Polyangiaceae bacterium]|nr:hypothetical protein [Polyangiaceae bacterium]
MLRIISWNIAHRVEPWRELVKQKADVALLQEARQPPADLRVRTDDQPWQIAAKDLQCPWRAAVAVLSDQLEVQFLEPHALADAPLRTLGVSRLGTLAAADVRDPTSGEWLTLVSMYAFWEEPRSTAKSPWIYADASLHRIISDLSVFIASEKRHRIIAAGDFNLMFGYGEDGNEYWARRYATIFERMAALGLDFVGPQHPNGRQAEPWPEELPSASKNVPTYHSSRQTPATATRQLDYVFASRELAPRVTARALNQPDEWGPSDHCRVMIEVAG